LIVKIMYFDDPAPAFDPMGNALRTMVAVTGLFVILFFVYPGPLVEAAGAAAKSLF
jgi:NADH-quinone oxidoreductase subunit N